MPILLPLALGSMSSLAALFDPRRTGGLRYLMPGDAVVHERGDAAALRANHVAQDQDPTSLLAW